MTPGFEEDNQTHSRKSIPQAYNSDQKMNTRPLQIGSIVSHLLRPNSWFIVKGVGEVSHRAKSSETRLKDLRNNGFS